jgi:hypothetical protein
MRSLAIALILISDGNRPPLCYHQGASCSESPKCTENIYYQAMWRLLDQVQCDITLRGTYLRVSFTYLLSLLLDAFRTAFRTASRTVFLSRTQSLTVNTGSL